MNASAIEKLNKRAPEFIRLLGGKIVDLDQIHHKVTFEFKVPLTYCHSGDIVQGGFVTAMADAAMSHSLFGTDDTISNVATLEISTRFLGPTPGEQILRVSGRVIKKTYQTAFLEAEVHNEGGEQLVSAQAVAKLRRIAKQS